MKRSRLAVAALAAVAVLAVGPSAGAAPASGKRAAATKITVAYENAAANFTPLFAAIGAGFFAQNGLEVTPFLATGGRATAILQSGDAQFTLDGGELNITAAARAGNMALLGALSNRFGFKLVARKPIARVEDLKGKKLALSSPSGGLGTAGHSLIRQFGLEGQVEVVYIPAISARLAALEAGTVDAIILSPPLGDVMKSGKYNDVYDLRSLRYLLIGIWAKQGYVSANPEVTRAFLRSLAQAMAFIRDPANKPATLKYLSDVTRVVDPAALEEAYDYTVRRYQEEPNIDAKALANSIAVVEKNIGKEIDANSFLNLGPLQRVLTYTLSGKIKGGVFSGTVNPQGRLTWRLRLPGRATAVSVRFAAKGGRSSVTLCTPCRPTQRGAVKVYSALARAIKQGNALVEVRTSARPQGVRTRIGAELGK
jgi:NitT/TauT family transport system substrate-binding protein